MNGGRLHLNVLLRKCWFSAFIHTVSSVKLYEHQFPTHSLEPPLGNAHMPVACVCACTELGCWLCICMVECIHVHWMQFPVHLNASLRMAHSTVCATLCSYTTLYTALCLVCPDVAEVGPLQCEQSAHFVFIGQQHAMVTTEWSY